MKIALENGSRLELSLEIIKGLLYSITQSALAAELNLILIIKYKDLNRSLNLCNNRAKTEPEMNSSRIKLKWKSVFSID